MTQDVEIGTGRHRYRFRRDWAVLPRWWSFGATAEGLPPQTAVQGAVAANGDVYVLSRSAHPVTVFDAEGKFITAWGEGRFSAFVHGLKIDRAGHVWITDAGTHTVSEHLPDGTLLRTLGAGFPSPTLYGKPFNMPTGVAFGPDGEILVSDGYGNRRVHRFGPDGTLRGGWGEPGTGPGQFALVHYIEIDARGRVYVADRENNRIQLFDAGGAHLLDWTGFSMPSDLAFGRESIVVGGQDGLSLWTAEREEIIRFGRDVAGAESLNIHGVWLDASENIYLAQFDRAVSKLSRIA